MRKHVLGVALLLAAALLLVPAAVPSQRQASSVKKPLAKSHDFVVVYAAGTSQAQARAAIARLGGTIVRENREVGVATVRSSNANFLTAVSSQTALFGAARDRPVGQAEPARVNKFSDERLDAERRAAPIQAAGAPAAPGSESSGVETFAPLQWDMAMIHATKYESHDVQPGNRGVIVGIIDTGVDATHPDIAPNFDASLSRNFTTDVPLVDGPCEDEPDHSCSDPATVDENSHGTHVAGTIGAAVNGLGIAGIAPNVRLVNLRAGQDSGFFFLQPSVDALTFAGDHGVDVVNMSYFIDPWLYNCRNNPADSPAAQMEQRTIIEATTRALRYAHKHDVTLVSALGNENTDIGRPTFDDISPDFPPGSEYHRTVDNGCLTMPSEGPDVIGVSALGPSTAKADYSNWGVEQTTVSAPGGWFRDYLGTPQHRTAGNLVLSTYAENVAREVGDVDEDGNPTNEFVLKDCEAEVCAYYTYFQGTSMASPHAVGVAALIVSQYGKRDRKHGGLRLDPKKVENILTGTAANHPCPSPRLFSYQDVGRGPEFDAFCEGGTDFNGFYGHGIVDALKAVTRRHHNHH